MIQYPRAYTEIACIVLGQEVVTGIVPGSLSVVRHSHKTADTCEFEVLGSALPFDPRYVEDASCAVFFGDVGSMNGDVKQEQFLRFVGYIDKIEPAYSTDKAPRVKVTARDYSALLRDIKPLSPRLTPTYSDTIKVAINRILDSLPFGAALDVRDNEEANTPLSPLTSARLRNAQITLPTNVSAWEVIEHICGLVGRLVRVDLDEIVVRRPSQALSSEGVPVAEFVYGSDDGTVMSVELERTLRRNRKGVRVTSYDPVSRTRYSAEYPPDSELPGRRARPRRSKRPPATFRRDPEEREQFAAPDGITSQDRLLQIAEQIYTEKSRQELSISVTTPLITKDYVGLKNGDRVTIKVRPDINKALMEAEDDASALEYLQHRLGVNKAAGVVLIRAARKPQNQLFYAKNITLQWSSEGKSSVKVEAINLVQIDGF